jgi:hypothetical protein
MSGVRRAIFVSMTIYVVDDHPMLRDAVGGA